MKVSFQKKVFHFKTPSGTSRGVLTEKISWFLKLELNGVSGIGECSVIPGLSPDYESDEQYEFVLNKVIEEVDTLVQNVQLLEKYPSILFGFEMAILDLMNNGKQLFFDNEFSKRNLKIPINGLVWMGSKDDMLNQVHTKVSQGFNCIKMKIGAINLEDELAVLRTIRATYSDKDLILRVDANGAFNKENVDEVLYELKKMNIHSIEQPIAVNQHAVLSVLCSKNIIPIALDEELIGIIGLNNKRQLLEQIRPQYIILKPSLHGGIIGTREWIKLAEELGIGWWITSALESNVGLKCIAQYTAEYPINTFHGLGTGSLYVDNLPSNLVVENGTIFEI